MSSPSPPGWFPDPTDRHLLRWWNGTHWDHATTGHGPGGQQPGSSSRPTVRRVAVAAAAMVILWTVVRWSVGLLVRREYQLDDWLFIAALPAPTAALIVAPAGEWRADHWPPDLRSLRRVTAITSCVLLVLVNVPVTAIVLFSLGPDCGVTPDAGARLQSLGVGVVCGLATASLPVALAGRRRAPAILGCIALAVPVAFGIVAAIDTSPGWCW